MITRAIIENLDLAHGRIQVYIPILHGKLDRYADLGLNWASVLCIPGLEVNYKVGDVVVVAFEDFDEGKPIILGHLLLEGNNMASQISGSFENLFVTNKFQAPVDSYIGKTPYSKLHEAVESMEDNK